MGSLIRSASLASLPKSICSQWISPGESAGVSDTVEADRSAGLMADVGCLAGGEDDAFGLAGATVADCRLVGTLDRICHGDFVLWIVGPVISRRRSLPVGPLGSSSRIHMWRGYL